MGNIALGLVARSNQLSHIGQGRSFVILSKCQNYQDIHHCTPLAPGILWDPGRLLWLIGFQELLLIS